MLLILLLSGSPLPALAVFLPSYHLQAQNIRPYLTMYSAKYYRKHLMKRAEFHAQADNGMKAVLSAHEHCHNKCTCHSNQGGAWH